MKIIISQLLYNTYFNHLLNRIEYIILIAIYLISAIYNYFWIRRAYFHEDGIWNNLKPTVLEFIFTIIPFLNIVFSIIMLFIKSTKDYSKTSWITKFFKISIKE